MEQHSGAQPAISLLYVEDDAEARNIVCQMISFRFPDLRIFCAANGRDGLDIFREHRPEIVVTDINMPVMDGIRMAAGIKEIRPDVNIIVVSAYSDTNYLLDAINTGISQYVLKPIDHRKLCEAIEKCIARIALERQVKTQNEEIEILNTNLAARALELEAANRELEAFNYTVSHDLRSPLTNISGFSQLLLELCGATLDEECKGYIRDIYQSTVKMNRLIGDLLKFSRLTRQEIHREEVDLSAVAHSIAAELRMGDLQRNVEFAIADGMTCNADPGLMHVVLANLLGNAWKYTARKKAARIEFGVDASHAKPVYFVRDNGAGFAMKEAHRLFGAFQRLHGKEEFEGTGIGLATVQRIIQRHGGRIWADGEIGRGAVFYFTLGEG